ncbi:MAG: cysteine hydrolase [Thermoproteota archaeon]|nr:cysteine hydrolase [Thermoproteota archaeon]
MDKGEYGLMNEKARVNNNGNDGGSSFALANQNPRFAILVIDMLNDFVYGKLKCERAIRIIPNIKHLLDDARQQGIPIFYCSDEHLPLDTPELKLWGPHAIKGTEGAKIIDELRPSDKDYIIPKRTYSAFVGTDLDKLLKVAYNGRGADALIITGLLTNICDMHAAYDAFVRGYDVIVAEDGVDAFTEEEHRYSLEYMKRIYGAKVKRVSDILANLKQQRFTTINYVAAAPVLSALSLLSDTDCSPFVVLNTPMGSASVI